MMELESVTFMLSHNDISTDDTFASYPIYNEFGRITENRCNATWYKVDFGKMLSEFDKGYKYYNLRLTCIMIDYIAVNSWASAGDANTQYLVSGLPFINYDVKNKTIPLEHSIFQQVNASHNPTYMNSSGLTFRRDNVNLVDFSIHLVSNSGEPVNFTANTLMPRCQFMFSIYPVIEW